MRRRRSTREVIEHHLECRERGDLEHDLEANYAPDVILLSAEGVNRGHDGVRRLAKILRSYIKDGRYTYDQILAEGDVGMLVWHAHGAELSVGDGADTYLVREGRIAAQTIHYTTEPAHGDRPDHADENQE